MYAQSLASAVAGSLRSSMARVLIFELLLGRRGISSPPSLPKSDDKHVEFGEGQLHLKSIF